MNRRKLVRTCGANSLVATQQLVSINSKLAAQGAEEGLGKDARRQRAMKVSTWQDCNVFASLQSELLQVVGERRCLWVGGHDGVVYSSSPGWGRLQRKSSEVKVMRVRLYHFNL